jgi:hypothetical protein
MGEAKYPRISCTGVPKSGDVKITVILGWDTPWSGLASTTGERELICGPDVLKPVGRSSCCGFPSTIIIDRVLYTVRTITQTETAIPIRFYMYAVSLLFVSYVNIRIDTQISLFIICCYCMFICQYYLKLFIITPMINSFKLRPSTAHSAYMPSKYPDLSLSFS